MRNFLVLCLNLYVVAAFSREFDDERLGDDGPDSEIEFKKRWLTRPEKDGYILYDVNPPEGFNLRRDVYLRLAVAVKKFADKEKERGRNWKLVLPPWGPLYHWRNAGRRTFPWSLFFDVEFMKSFAPVIELQDVPVNGEGLVLDKIYALKHYPDAFENGYFREKWEIDDGDSCEYSGRFWGRTDVTVRDVRCVKFQGSASKLTEILSANPADRTVLFANAEIALHDEYGTAEYWDARKSVRFASALASVADEFVKTELGCSDSLCDNYLGVHWRRRDFAAGRPRDVPSVGSTAKQIVEILKSDPRLKTVFIATDAIPEERYELFESLSASGIRAVTFDPSEEFVSSYGDGGVAIVDQIVCSRAARFVGTHESTFSYRIQEEREILGFESETTFNRLCPDRGECEPPSKWRIVRS